MCPHVLAQILLQVPPPQKVTAPPPDNGGTHTLPDPEDPAGIARQAREQRLREEQEKMRKQMQKNLQSRRRNNRLGPGEIWHRFHHNLRAFRRVLDGKHGAENFLYENDDPDSDVDDIDHEQTYAQNAINAGNVEERIEVEIFLTHAVNLHLDPSGPTRHKSMDSWWKDYDGDHCWYLYTHLSENRPMFLWESTRALNPEQYADHLKAMLYMECHFQMQRGLFDTFPRLSSFRDTSHIVSAVKGNLPRYEPFLVRVDAIGKSRMQIELK